MEKKYKELLGRLVRIYMGLNADNVEKTDENIGDAVIQFMDIVLHEEMRDARDKANGKGV